MVIIIIIIVIRHGTFLLQIVKADYLIRKHLLSRTLASQRSDPTHMFISILEQLRKRLADHHFFLSQSDENPAKMTTRHAWRCPRSLYYTRERRHTVGRRQGSAPCIFQDSSPREAKYFRKCSFLTQYSNTTKSQPSTPSFANVYFDPISCS